MAMLKDRFALLVVSCDKYADLWPPFFRLFFHFWPDCPFTIYLLSNNERLSLPGVNSILVGNDVSWSDNLLKAGALLPHDYLLLFIDDLFLIDYVQTEKVEEVCHWLLDAKANYVRLNPSVPPDGPGNDLVGSVSKGTLYRASTVLSVWKREVLLSLLKPGENAWQFEGRGSLRSDRYDAFYSTRESLFPVLNGVIKGKWDRTALRRLSALGVSLDLRQRGCMTVIESSLLFLQRLRFRVLHLLPAAQRRKIKHLFQGATRG